MVSTTVSYHIFTQPLFPITQYVRDSESQPCDIYITNDKLYFSECALEKFCFSFAGSFYFIKSLDW